MSTPADSPSKPFASGEVLPPVEPPSAGFILQLFVIPGVIVAIIVLVWLLFSHLAQMGRSDPKAYIAALDRNNEGRWQAAFNLANDLHNEKGPQYEALRGDANLAQQLGDILLREIEAGSMQEQAVTFRIYLCRALREFYVPHGLPALVKAAGTERDAKEAEVRWAALESIAVLVENVRQKDPAANLDEAELEPMLLRAARESEPMVRKRAAFVLGVVGGRQALEELRSRVSDSYPDVRYNAATGLARHGDPAAIQVLVEMLNPEEKAGIKVELEEQAKGQKGARIVENALRAARQLHAKNPAADVSALESAVEQFLGSKPNRVLEIQAKQTLSDLSGASAAEAEK
jgi:HEAT repeat protein